ncbi:MAG: AAA family ATPase, partial [Chloroflexi bacterium]|nr:AAA family ATPase [Chloroflexota bacterium]
MRLRSVELHGYKSFAARTALQFDAPLTAVVGPNGSGKSNVMDGLRWAIGAVSGRDLRTRRAEVVVFSGGRDRAPSGFAEVRVQLDNSERWLDLDAAEVEVVRRVHRDGQSDLRINGRAARLRDVQDLFRNSGLGSGGFALMSQGLVDEMLRLRPLERRQAIEEVSGVRHHRHQMEESR